LRIRIVLKEDFMMTAANDFNYYQHQHITTHPLIEVPAKTESSYDLIWYCIRAGIKAAEISRALGVSPSSISKLQSGRLKRLRPPLHAKLAQLKCSLKVLA
jgi:transcriptional regulator with XRE-family HTH domain